MNKSRFELYLERLTKAYELPIRPRSLRGFTRDDLVRVAREMAEKHEKGITEEQRKKIAAKIRQRINPRSDGYDPGFVLVRKELMGITDVIRKLQPAELTKQQIRKFCEEKCYIPSQTSKDPTEKRLGQAFNKFSKKNGPRYDEAFTNEIRSNYPTYSEFIGIKPASETKEEIIKHCLEKKYIPSSTSKDPVEKRLGNAFLKFSTKNYKQYDEAFSNEIRSKYPTYRKFKEK